MTEEAMTEASNDALPRAPSKVKSAPFDLLTEAAEALGKTPYTLAEEYGYSARQVSVWYREGAIPVVLAVAVNGRVEASLRRHNIVLFGRIRNGMSMDAVHAALQTIFEEFTVAE